MLTSWVSIFARAMEIDGMCLLCVPSLAFSFFIQMLNSDSHRRDDSRGEIHSHPRLSPEYIEYMKQRCNTNICQFSYYLLCNKNMSYSQDVKAFTVNSSCDTKEVEYNFFFFFKFLTEKTINSDNS